MRRSRRRWWQAGPALLLPVLLLSALAGQARAEAVPGQPCVVLLHGLWRTELSMKAVQWKLESAGFTVANLTYPSLTHPIQELAQLAVNEGLQQCREAGFDRFDFVTHSLGGILLRQYLAHDEIPGLRRVVMLAPPNQGSQMADFVNSQALLQRFEPVPVAQLGTGEDSLPQQLGPVDFTVGVIAGNLNLRPPLPGIPQEPSDGTVTVEETRVAGMVDFIEVGATHSFIMWNTGVLDQVVYFLQNGHFDHTEPAPPVPAEPHGPPGR